jgi:hypothetical protein
MEQFMMLYSVKYGKPEVYEEFCLNTYIRRLKGLNSSLPHLEAK